MDNKKLMETAEGIVRINALLKQEGWEVYHFAPKANPYDGGPMIKLEIVLIDENPFLAPKESELAGTAGLPHRVLGMTIRELVEKFHGLPGIERYVKMVCDLTEADEKDQRVQERRSKLAALQAEARHTADH
jgi:hypothetical protein